MSFCTRKSKILWQYRFCNRLSPKKCRLCLLVVTVIIIVALLHFYLLPVANGGYNSECYLKDQDRNDLRYAIQMIGKTMEKHNITYWLDYGTLLGAVQVNDVLSWDSDGDISYLLKDENPSFHRELLEHHGISSNPFHASYKGKSIDYMRWEMKEGDFEGKKKILLFKYYPESVLRNENIFILHHMKLETFPLSWVKPTKKVNYHGAQLAIPNVPNKHLRHRYPLSFPLGVSLPYKWKCYVPCWLRKAPSCV